MNYSGAGWSPNSKPPAWWDDVAHWMGSPYGRWQMSQLPFVGGALKAMDQQKFYNDYLRNRGMTWADVKYPALLGGQTAFGAGINASNDVIGYAVSRNILRLYK